jgi:hypothetical protein
MAKTKDPEIRLSQGAFIAIIAVVALLLVGFNQGWFTGNAEVPEDSEETETETGVPMTIVPAIEKTKIYVSAYDNADYEDDSQKNRVAGESQIIKSGNVIETLNTSASTGVASTAEFNGGDEITFVADAPNYYANYKVAKITETLQPFEVMIQESAVPDVYTEDDSGDTVSTITLDQNDVSKTHTLVIERPGDTTSYQLCGIAADFDDDQIEIRVKDKTGSFVEGDKNLDDKYDNLDTNGADMVWEYDEPIMDFDSVTIDFVVGTAKDVDPSATNLTLTVFDCENNLQNGKVVYTSEDSADADVGLANIEEVIAIN